MGAIAGVAGGGTRAAVSSTCSIVCCAQAERERKAFAYSPCCRAAKNRRRAGVPQETATAVTHRLLLLAHTVPWVKRPELLFERRLLGTHSAHGHCLR